MSRAIALRLAALQKRRKADARRRHEEDFKRPIWFDPKADLYVYDNYQPVHADDPRNVFGAPHDAWRLLGKRGRSSIRY
jgi:hypothetical protein